jgi:hypothetical protein
MFSLSRLATAVITVALVFALPSAAQGSIPWSGLGGACGPSGTASWFDWTNGHNSDTNLFESPTLVGGNAFRFFPTAFRADANNGSSSGWVNDMAQWDAEAHDGYQFSEIRITERGDWGIGGSHPDNLGKVQTYVAVDDNDILWPSVLGNDLRQWTAAGGAPWSMSIVLDLSMYNLTNIHVQVENNLLAISGGQGNSVFVHKKMTASAVDVEIIPEPATLAMLLAGGLLAIRRRR